MTTKQEFREMAEFIRQNFDTSPRDEHTFPEYARAQANLGVMMAFEHMAERGGD